MPRFPTDAPTHVGPVEAWAGAARRIAGGQAHDVQLLNDMAEFLESVFLDLDRAERRIFIENYIVTGDVLGEALLHRLERAAARGVDVRLLYDPSGSHTLPPARLASLGAAGVTTRPYGRAPFLRRFRPGFRNHARLVLADDVAYTGGHAWQQLWLPRAAGGAGWADANCRVTGPITETWATIFSARWREAPTRWPASFDTGDHFHPLRLISDGPGWGRRIAVAYARAFDRARSRIWIGNAYFFPTRGFTRALYRACARGIDVKIMVPGASDIGFIRRAARAQYPVWIAHGLELHEYQDAMMHAKYAVIDDCWATVGSFNALATALSFTVETNLVVEDPGFVAQAAARFERDLRACRTVSPAALRALPLRDRLLDGLARAALIALDRVLQVIGWLMRRRLARTRRLPRGASVTA